MNDTTAPETVTLDTAQKVTEAKALDIPANVSVAQDDKIAAITTDVLGATSTDVLTLAADHPAMDGVIDAGQLAMVGEGPGPEVFVALSDPLLFPDGATIRYTGPSDRLSLPAYRTVAKGEDFIFTAAINEWLVSLRTFGHGFEQVSH